MKCEKCGVFTGDLESVALELVMALRGITILIEGGDHPESKIWISNLFEYLAIPLDNAVSSADAESVKGGGK